MSFSWVVSNKVKADERTCGAGVLEGAEWAAEIWEGQKCLGLN